MPNFNHQAAAAYARRWAKSTNPKYPRFGEGQEIGEDCTNFVSQAMLAGGWTMVGWGDFDRGSDIVWWYGQGWFARASHTWSGAPNFARFLVASGRGSRAKNPRELQPGDIIQLRDKKTGVIGHSAIVTGKTGTDLKLSYHSHDKLDESFNGIVARSPGSDFVFWKISGAFPCNSCWPVTNPFLPSINTGPFVAPI
jgi:hypothetical protein